MRKSSEDLSATARSVHLGLEAPQRWGAGAGDIVLCRSSQRTFENPSNTAMKVSQLLIALIASSTFTAANAQVGSDDCATATPIVGAGSYLYDNSTATTGTQGQNQTLCYAFGTSGISNDLWFEWTASATGSVTVHTCFSTQDTKIAAYLGGGCPAPGSLLSCNDDLCSLQSEISFPVISGDTYTLQIGNFPGAPGGPGSFDLSFSPSSGPGTAFCFCDAGNAPCGNAGAAGNGCANRHFANGANLTASGSVSMPNTVMLTASGLPPGQPGLYFQGDNTIAGGLGLSFGDGLRCAGQNIIRLGVVVSDPAGNSDTSGFAQPINVLGQVIVGSSLKHYQLWYRDPWNSPCGSGFNLTNGYSIQW